MGALSFSMNLSRSAGYPGSSGTYAPSAFSTASNPTIVSGSIVVYLLLGLIWAEAYTLAANLNPASFAAALPEEPIALIAHLTYFSFVTLTTVGYGDILPASLVTRALANFEGLLGTLFPAILIARLVSMEITARETTK